MLRGPLSDLNFKGQFSGHETFPLRHLWLRKAYDAVDKHEGGAPRGLFTDPDAFIRFGVGKNMVSSIRHWSLACDIIRESREFYCTTEMGRFLFDRKVGHDPFMESPATTWLLQWLIAGRPTRTTTWYFVFNHFLAQTFDRDAIVTSICDLCSERGWTRTSAATIKRDVECFVRSYVPKANSKFSDDNMESVLSELGLIRAIGSRYFEFRRGPKPGLPNGVFLYALHEFWKWYAPDQNTISVESLAYEPGSPGRVFKLDENSLVERLAEIDDCSGGQFLWTDTAGVRNVARGTKESSALALLELAYSNGIREKAA